MTRTESIAEIKRLLNIKFEAVPPPVPAKPAPAKPAQVPVKAKPTLTKIKQNTDGSPDMQSLMIAIAELQDTVPALSQYAQLLSDYNALTKRVAQMEAGFNAMQKEIAMTLTPVSSKEVMQSAGLMTSKDEKLKKYFPK